MEAPQKSPERKLAESIAEQNGFTLSKLGLRFDRVVLGFFEDLRAFAKSSLPKGATLIFTMTAPVKRSGKTELDVEEMLAALLARNPGTFDKKMIIHGNRICLRMLEAPKGSPRLIGFVHNPSTKAKLLLDLATEWLNISSR